MKFDQDLCLNLQYDFGKMNSTLGSVVPLAMFEIELFVPSPKLVSAYEPFGSQIASRLSSNDESVD